MILESVVNAILVVVTWIVGLAPDITAQDATNINTIHTIIAQARGYFNWVNFFFPIDTLFLIIGLFILVEFVSFVYKLTRWIGSILTAGLLH